MLRGLLVIRVRFFFAMVLWENDGWLEKNNKNRAIHTERCSMSCSLKADGSLGMGGNHLK
jgi:hypothetical protein